MDIMTLIQTVGFPGAVCLYTLMSVKKAVDANTQAVTIMAAKMGVDMHGTGNSNSSTKA